MSYRTEDDRKLLLEFLAWATEQFEREPHIDIPWDTPELMADVFLRQRAERQEGS